MGKPRKMLGDINDPSIAVLIAVEVAKEAEGNPAAQAAARAAACAAIKIPTNAPGYAF